MTKYLKAKLRTALEDFEAASYYLGWFDHMDWRYFEGEESLDPKHRDILGDRVLETKERLYELIESINET